MNFFPIYIQPFMNDSNSRNNNSQGFKNSWLDMAGCVWVGGSFLRNDKWQTKFLTLEEQNKGPQASRGWSYIMPMKSQGYAGVG